MKQLVTESKLAALAKRFRKESKNSKAAVARELKLSEVSIHNAEEAPEQSLTKVRIRLIEKYSPFRVVGPMYLLEKK